MVITTMHSSYFSYRPIQLSWGPRIVCLDERVKISYDLNMIVERWSTFIYLFNFLTDVYHSVYA